MKPETKGRRFSKIRTVTGDAEEIKDYILARYNKGRDGKIRIGVSFSERMKKLWRAAEDTLKRQGLPHTPSVWKSAKGWSMEKPAEFSGCSRLDYHIIKRLGFDHDSLEGLSARIIALIDETQSSQGERRDEVFFELGNLHRLMVVYGIDTPGKKNGGDKGGGHNRKATDEELLRAYKSLKIPERNRASKLAERYGVTASAIRQRLRQLLQITPPKKRKAT